MIYIFMMNDAKINYVSYKKERIFKISKQIKISMRKKDYV